MVCETNADSVFVKAAKLGLGMNLGNALEVSNEGEQALTLESHYFDRIADAGFDSIRVPIRWSAHAEGAAPYAIGPKIFDRVDWVLAQARRTGLAVVINVHHYDELMESPFDERPRYLSLWDQIARRYSCAPDDVFFELLNEPTKCCDEQPHVWNAILAETVDVVRQSNPHRALIVGSVGCNAINRLPDLEMPDDHQLIASVHFYSPFAFTHQGAEWSDPVPPTGVRFDPDRLSLCAAFQDWSWDTDWEAASSGVVINYHKEYAGLNLHLHAVEKGAPQQLRLRVSGAAHVSINCGSDGCFKEVGRISQDSATLQEHVVDLSSCPQGTVNVVLQNQNPSPDSVVLEKYEISIGSRVYNVFETASEGLKTELQIAADWAAHKNVPMYVGEFGAYHPGCMDSRAAWTRSVRKAMQELGMTGAYWEFGAGFGCFNLEEDRYYEPLLQALRPEGKSCRK